jgi:hypothetical protein
MDIAEKRKLGAALPMALGDKLVYAAAFAGAFAVELRHRPAEINEQDEAALRDWQSLAAVKAARHALGAVIGLKMAETGLGAMLDAETLDAEDMLEAVVNEQMIASFRAEGGGCDEDLACPYERDGQCGGPLECATCEHGGADEADDDQDDGDEDMGEGLLSLDEQTIAREVAQAVGQPLCFERVVGLARLICMCETCEKECKYREAIMRAVAMMRKVCNGGQHDA